MERIQQKIYLSRKGLNSLEFEHDVLRIPLKAGEETSFELLVINHGEPTHVHFSLSKGIREKLMLMQDKAYIIDEERIAAIVRLPKSYAGAEENFGIGEIFVSTGYGATKRSFSVEIMEPQEPETTGEEAGTGQEMVDTDTMTKEKKALSRDERELLSHLAVSACAAVIFFILVVLIVHLRVFDNSPGYLFVSALITAIIFIFIVIYNS
jgi:hypothetical protein